MSILFCRIKESPPPGLALGRAACLGRREGVIPGGVGGGVVVPEVIFRIAVPVGVVDGEVTIAG
jgi:hypothetical protein